METKKERTPGGVYDEYERGRQFKQSIGLYDTVEQNENFFLGNQWEGVQSNGLPTPVFNEIEQIVGHLVASLVTDNIKLQASPMDVAGQFPKQLTDTACDMVNNQFERICENVKLTSKVREVMRNCAVDGDGCFYLWWDDQKPTGQLVPGDLELEIVENTRVIFGNPHTNSVERQPFIIIARRETLQDAKRRAKRLGGRPDDIKPDTDDINSAPDASHDDKVTVLLRLWKAYDSDGNLKGVRAYECTQSAIIRPEWDIGISVYPVCWINWNFVLNRYHGQAVVTSLIPNQIFINKLFAMTMLSLMTTAYPKVIFDKTRVPKWDNRVGAAIPVNGGDVDKIVKIVDPAQISPQVAQFMDAAIKYTKDFKGASDAALGNVRPDNTSAIVAVQRAAAMPLEMVKQSLYQFIEDFGRVVIAFMASYYGVRFVESYVDVMGVETNRFDFSLLQAMPLSIKLDVGSASYWSEIAGIQTLDNLLINGKIEASEYLERLPRGFVPKLGELTEKVRQREMLMQMMMGMPPMQGGGGGVPTAPVGNPMQGQIPIGPGDGGLQRAIREAPPV